jgi:hypothetical protein
VQERFGVVGMSGMDLRYILQQSYSISSQEGPLNAKRPLGTAR